jgi:hypothetical protein
MPDTAIATFRNPDNAKLMDYIRDRQGSDYALRVPSATQASVREAFEKMWSDDLTRNQFVSALVNLIGLQIVRGVIWRNVLAPFKRGLLTYGDTIEEIMVGLREAYEYDQNRDYLEKAIFGSEPNEVQTRFHRVNRENYYKLTIKEDVLMRAFFNEGGLSQFVAELMSSMYTSDQWDEFLLMARLFKIYEEEDGFYKVHTPDLTDLTETDATSAKQFIKQVRAMMDTLPFVSRDYNAAHMPAAVDPTKLLLITTPEAKANMDVEALAAAFNISMQEISAKIIVLPARYIGIKGFQALLTTEDFFVVADTKLETRTVQNPVGLITNYFLHHWQVISASAFVPAILFTSEEVEAIEQLDPAISGLNPITFTDTDGNDATSVERGLAVHLDSSVIFNSSEDTDMLNSGIMWEVQGKTSDYTRVTQAGWLFAGYNERANALTVVGRSAETPAIYVERNIGVVGDLVQATIGMTVDENPGQIALVHLPRISSADGTPEVGQKFTATPGDWDTDDLTFGWQWKLDGAPINGATTNSYTPVPTDAGHNLTVTVTPSRTGYTLKGAGTSQPVALVASS